MTELNTSYKRALVRPTLDFADEVTLTQQQFADECDINNIVAKYSKTGVITHLNERSAQFGDVSSVSEFHDAMNIITTARETFEGLPATLRKRFNNDPAEFLTFMDDPKNVKEAIELGLATERVETPPPVTLVKVVSEEKTKDAS